MAWMIGWRKLSAWLMVFGLCAFVSVKTVLAGGGDIPAGVIDLVKWVTGFFFAGNAIENLAGKITVTTNGKSA